MKHLIPAAMAILILGICGLARREETTPRVAPSPASESLRTESLATEARVQEDAPAPESKPRASAGEATMPTPQRAESTVPVSEIRELRDVLRSTLDLSELQEDVVSAALQTRLRDLKDCHEAYRRNGVFLPWEYGRQLARMKESWYRAIDRILDSRQHEVFDGLVQGGFFRPGTEFTADLSEMIVVR